MMQDETDDELLRLAAQGSREALAEVARRYAGFVYHSALRAVGDPHLAADVAQAVFIILSNKIARLKRGTVLHAWLFTTTRYAAANARKIQARRTHHERNAAAMRHESIQSPDTESSADAVLPLLDEALADLGEVDRTALLLSYFGGQTFAQVGARIGKTEEAARKRVARAVARMRAFFARRGVEVGGAGLVAAMQSSADAAVPHEVMRAISASLGSVPTSAAVATIARGITHMMNWMKVKLAAAFVVAAALCLGGGMLAADGASPRAGTNPRRQPPAPAPQVPSQPTIGGSVQFANNVRVELLGLAAVPVQNGAWWDLNGRSVPPPIDEAEQLLEGAQYQAAVQVDAPKGSSIAIRVGPCKSNYNDKATRGGQAVRGLSRIEFLPDDGQTGIDVFVRVGCDPFRTMLDCADPAAGADAETRDGPVSVAPLIDDGQGRACAVFNHALSDHYVRVYAIDAAGKELDPVSERTHSDGDAHELTVVFGAPPNQIKRVRLDARPLNDWVQFKSVPLDPARLTDVRVLAGDDPTTQPGR